MAARRVRGKTNPRKEPADRDGGVRGFLRVGGEDDRR